VKSDPLWQLNKLCNLDKHQTVGYSSTETRFRFQLHGGVPDPEIIHHFNTGVSEVVMPMAHKGLAVLHLEPPMQIFGKPIDAPGAAFELSAADLAAIHPYVKDELLPKFAVFIPEGSSLWPPVMDGKPEV